MPKCFRCLGELHKSEFPEKHTRQSTISEKEEGLNLPPPPPTHYPHPVLLSLGGGGSVLEYYRYFTMQAIQISIKLSGCHFIA